MQYAFTYVYLLTFVSLVVLATLDAALSPARRDKPWRLGITISAAFWALSDLMCNLGLTPDQIEMTAWVFAPSYNLIPYFIFMMVLRYTGWPAFLDRPRMAFVLLIPAMISLGIVWSGAMYRGFIPASENGLFFQPLATPWQIPVNGIMAAYVGLAVFFLLASARFSGDPKFKASARLVIFRTMPFAALTRVLSC